MAKQPTSVTIAVLGGGGRYWCPTVLRDLALCPDLTGEIRLHGRTPSKLASNVKVGRQVFQHPDSKTRFKLSATTSLREALKGADFVFIGISPGPNEMFANDLDIPSKYGILQTVGDTTGPAGISRALRSVPIHMRYAEAVSRTCPDAWVINYTNPMTLCTAALFAGFQEIKAFGCCHEVAAAKTWLAKIVESELGVSRPPRDAIRMDVAGVNHFTFATAASFEDRDLFPVMKRYMKRRGRFADASEYARDNAARGALWDHKGLVSMDFFRKFGALGAAGDRHLVEFVPWYLGAGEDALHRWGVVVTPGSFRKGTWTPAPGVKAAPNPLDASGGIPKKLKPSGEEAVQQVCALLGIQDLDTNVNIPNCGQLEQLPLCQIVETNAQFRHNSVRPIVPKPLPKALAPLVNRICDVQRLTLEAAISCNFDTALQAVLLDPLCTIGTDKAARMLKEMIQANKALLPGWKN